MPTDKPDTLKDFLSGVSQEDPVRGEDHASPTPSLASLWPKVAWAIAVFSAIAGSYIGATGIEEANGAPQQAAAAAMGCFYMIGPYIIARAVTELSK